MRFWAVIAIVTVVIFTASAAQKAEKVSVTIQNMSFSPGSITVQKGGSVVWTNRDDQDHTVVARDGSFDSGNLKPGDSFPQQFTKPGSYAYVCGLHPRMKGTVVVSE